MISTERILLSLGMVCWERDEQNCAKINLHLFHRAHLPDFFLGFIERFTRTRNTQSEKRNRLKKSF